MVCGCSGKKLESTPLSTGLTHNLTAGCKVRIALDVEVFKQMQTGHGGWNDQMADVSPCVMIHVYVCMHMYSTYILSCDTWL